VIIARFSREGDFAAAVRRLPADRIESFTPYPVESEESPRQPPVPLIALAAGLIGFAASLSLQIYADTIDYPLDIGGRPLNSWPAFIPTAFENGMLAAVLAGFLWFVARMASDHAPHVGGAMRDGYFIALQPSERARALLREAGAELTELPP